MEEEIMGTTQEHAQELPRDIPPYRWFISILADGTYHFVTPYALERAEGYIGKNGGGIYTHAGYLIFAANKSWWRWLMNAGAKTRGETWSDEDLVTYPQLDVPNIECVFSQEALDWLDENEELLKEKGGKYYENLPRN